MSQSPVQAEGSADPYFEAWVRINALIERGFSWSGHEENVFFLNLGEGRFANASHTSGLDLGDDGRAAVAVDWDRDGDLDLFTTNRNGPRLRFLRNTGKADGGYVAFRLEGEFGPDPIGARVLLEKGGRDGGLAVRALRAGEGFLAQGSAWLHFGLGEARIGGVQVRWPDGEMERFGGVVRGGRYLLKRGLGRAQALETGKLEIPTRPPLDIDESDASTMALVDPIPMPRLPMATEDGRPVELFGIDSEGAPRTTPGPLVLQLWASWCQPCARELEQVSRRASELTSRGVGVIALQADGEEEPQPGSFHLDQVRWPFSRAVASESTLGILEAFQSLLLDREAQLVLPTTLLIDPKGRLVSITRGEMDFDRMLAELDDVGLSAEERRDKVVPFPGRWLYPPIEPDMERFAREFSERGFPRVAVDYRAQRFDMARRSRAELLHEFGRSHARNGDLESAEKSLRESIAADPQRVEVHADLGLVLHQAGRFREAVVAYESALALAPERDDVHFNLALALISLGQFEGAEDQLSVLQGLDSPRAEGLRELLERTGR